MKTNNKTNNLKKLLTLVLTLCLALALIPALATKASAATVITDTIDLDVGTEKGNSAAATTPGTWYWDGVDTLTLNTVDIDFEGYSFGFSFNLDSATEPMFVNLVGNNVLNTTTSGLTAMICSRDGANITIKGNGQLSCYTGNQSVINFAGNLIVTDGAVLYATNSSTSCSPILANSITCTGMALKGTVKSNASIEEVKNGSNVTQKGLYYYINNDFANRPDCSHASEPAAGFHIRQPSWPNTGPLSGD